MTFDMNNLMLRIKKIVYPSIRFGYQSACEYPVVLGIGVLLLFLHKLCPSLLSFLLASSPVFLLTALLLGALLSYGEPSAPVIREETLENQKKSSPISEISVNECSVEVQNVAVTHAAKSFESPYVCIEERTSDNLVHDTHRHEENITYVSADTVLCAETSELAKNDVIVEREEECVREICENVELQNFESTNTERCHYDVNNQYQFGEFMSSCWQPVMRQEPCSDSESDHTESSSDASITDIIPMLDRLNPSVNLRTDHPSSTFRDNLNSSSDDDEDVSEDGDLSSDEDSAEEKKDDGNNWKDFMDPKSSDTEKNGNLESLMERRKAKNILKFDLDRRLTDMQAADAIQKMEEASRFRVQVPSISTPRPNPLDPSNGLEEMVELPQIPDSAPSVLLPWTKPFDQIVGCDSRLQETWTPRSCFPSKQHRKHENLYFRQSTHLRHQNSMKPEKPEVNEKDAVDNHSDSDSEQAWNNGKLFGSLEPHVGDEIKILSAAISDVCVLEVNHGINEGTKSTDSIINGTDSFYIQKSISSTSEVNDSLSAGCEQLLSCSLSEEYNTEKHIVEADSISEVNSLFKCRMEEVLVQSLSESGIDQPLTGKLEHELNDTLSAESAMPSIEERSVEELNSQFTQLNGEALLCAASDSSCDDEPIQDRSTEALPVENGHTSELPTKDGYSYPTLDNPMDVNIECKSKDMLTEDTELPVLEASSVEEMNSLFRQLDDEAPAQMPRSPDLMVGEHNRDIYSGVLVPNANSSKGISSAFVHLSNDYDKIKIPGDGEVILDSAELNSGLHVMETNALDGDDTSGSDNIKAIEVK